MSPWLEAKIFFGFPRMSPNLLSRRLREHAEAVPVRQQSFLGMRAQRRSVAPA